MESKVTGGEEERGERQKVERLVEKLKNYTTTTKNNNNGDGPSTPVHVSFSGSSKLFSPSDVVSSRKLAAAFWEFHHYYCYQEEDRSFFSPPPAAAEMHRRQRHGKAVVKENGLDLSQFLRDPSPDHQPESAGSLRRQIGQVLMKHHQSLERNNHALQPVSPASYGSSLEVAPYNKAVTPSSSLEFRGRQSREPQYNLKTSTELLKVLNRIWSLEEQHAANISLIKSLKTELAHSRVRIKELLRYQQADRHELNGVVKQLAEENLMGRNTMNAHTPRTSSYSDSDATQTNLIVAIKEKIKQPHFEVSKVLKHPHHTQMESKVTGGEEERGERQKVERLVEKLKNYTTTTTKNNNNGDGPSTPVHVSFSGSSKLFSPSDVVSSRKLAAAFWEFHHYYCYQEEDRSFFSPPPAAAEMHRRQRHGKAVVKENGLDLSQFLRDPSPDHQPESAGSLRRQIGQVLMKHHQSLERNNHALQPVSPASYGSSLEVAPYNKAVTPSSSLEFRGRQSREPQYNLKTSTELLKVRLGLSLGFSI
ncbi:hypothetical protein F2Q70_00027447 [Brassica cretica]|uniref:Uncharacterized protein n=1 Tax=Brassica cretica TaxID=69181 RepID=A0A8S9LA36_BRACR|nr:hypothetical protein F2Q70_00027447 [Brassica cretica]